MYEQQHDLAEQHRPVAAIIAIVVHFNTQVYINEIVGKL